MTKNILIIGGSSKIAQKFVVSNEGDYSITTTQTSPVGDNSNAIQLDLSNSESVAHFITSQEHTIFDAVLVFASVYEKDPDSTEAYLERAEIDMKINVFSPLAILRKLNYTDNSTILLFGDAGTEAPKNHHSLYTLSKVTILTMAKVLAVQLKDTTKVLTLRLGPTLAPDSRKDQNSFYQKNLLQVETTSDGLVRYCNFLINENNLGMTGTEIVYDSGTYLQR